MKSYLFIFMRPMCIDGTKKGNLIKQLLAKGFLLEVHLPSLNKYRMWQYNH